MPHLLKKLSTGFPSYSAWKTYKALHFWSPRPSCFPSAFISNSPLYLLCYYSDRVSWCSLKTPNTFLHVDLFTCSSLCLKHSIQMSQAHPLTSTSVFKYYFTWWLHLRLYWLTHNFYFPFLFCFSPSHFYLLISYTINSKFFVICCTQTHTAKSKLHEERTVSILFTVVPPAPSTVPGIL